MQIEVLASGKPVVCCELGNGVTWLKHDGFTGLLVPPADPAALAGALRRLMQDPALRARLGEQGRARAFGVFAAEAMARGTLEIYRAVLQTRN